jgi:hypothetical protein
LFCNFDLNKKSPEITRFRGFLIVLVAQVSAADFCPSRNQNPQAEACGTGLVPAVILLAPAGIRHLLCFSFQIVKPNPRIRTYI